MHLLVKLTDRAPSWVIFAALVVGVAGTWVLLIFRRSTYARDLNFLQYANLLALCMALLLVTLNGVRIVSSVSVADTFLALAAVLFGASVVLGGRLRAHALQGFLLAGSLVIASAAASAFLGRVFDVTDNSIVTLELAAAMLVVPILISESADSPSRLQLITSVWVSSAAVNGLVGCLDMLGVSKLGSLLNPGEGLEGRFAALATHPNVLAIACAMALPTGIYLTIAAASLWKRAFCAFAVVSICGGILVSGSRGGLASGGVGVLILYWLRPETRKAIFASGTLVAAAGFIVILRAGIEPRTAFGALYRISGAVSGEGSDIQRLHAARVAVTALGQYPIFGEGYKYIHLAQSYYLGLLQAGGVFGLFCFALFETWALFVARATLAREHRDPVNGLAAAAIAAMCVFFVAGLAENTVYDRFLYVPVGLLLAIRGMPAARDERQLPPIESKTAA